MFVVVGRGKGKEKEQSKKRLIKSKHYRLKKEETKLFMSTPQSVGLSAVFSANEASLIMIKDFVKNIERLSESTVGKQPSKAHGIR